ncbi:hypothetical protein BDV33DRAFT_191832 [Aspergillus novoparasiticus]|uniref:Lysine-specific metallo-endopeptidase domain-containing protein n=1 Tax=Aspergillus novoparasiticus TaxID=986946 RepID=A0A5N6EQM6_9EURO|nr:hypothetical protein BDV33DRAFT_191832 [Aspergillus novoparasiticus]
MHLSNLILTLTITSLTTANTLKLRAVFVKCNNSESHMAQAAVIRAGEMAAKAAASIRANNEASQQGSGLVTYSCQLDSITCQSGSFTQTGYASTDGYRGQVSTCPVYFQLPQASDDCSVLDQRMSSLHELCHIKGVLGYEVYGYSNVLGLDSQTALKNAESYAFFSKFR